MTTPPNPPAPTETPRPKRRARWPFVIFTIVVIGMAVWWAKSAIIRALILPVASRVTGCSVRAATATITLDGEVILRDVTVRAPGVRGPASELLSADEVRLEPDWSTFPPTAPRSIELRRPIIRVSQAEDLSLNLAPLLQASGAASSGPPPDVRLDDAIIELGEHRQNQFAPMAHLAVSGALTAQDATRSVYSLVLSQKPMRAPRTPDNHTTILGTINRADGSLHIDVVGLDLADLNPQPGASSFRGYWEQLAIDGRIPDASVDYAPSTGIAATFTLDNVAMKIPVPASPDPAFGAEPADSSQIELLAMSAVTGNVVFDASGLHADIEGSIEDLRCAVHLATSGLSLDAPLTCTLQIPEFVLTDEPRLRPFAPPLARKIFQRFSGPTATLSGRVVINRASASAGARWSYRGAFELRDGAARYEGFPYPVSGIDATFLFDDTEFRIARLSGVGPTGAKLLASGRIWPPGDLAAVEVDVTTADLPMDRFFQEAMPEAYRGVFDFLFDAEAAASIRTAGLIAGPDAPGAPAFALGGVGTMEVKVTREHGEHTQYYSDITLHIPRASLMPHAFQYPVVASDAQLHIAHGLVTISPMTLEGLTGARGTLEGTVAYSEEAGGSYVPDVRLSVRDVPVDDLLLHAIDQRTSSPDRAPDAPDPGALVRALNVRGGVACDAHILERTPDHIGVDAAVSLDSLEARPGPDVTLTDLRGVITVTESRVGATDITAALGDGSLRIGIDAPISAVAGAAPQPTSLSIDATRLDLGAPIEQAALALLPPARAEEVTTLRNRYNPAGIVDASVDVAAVPGAPWTWSIDLRRAENLGLTLEVGRLGMASVSGSAHIDTRVVTFDDLAGPASLDGEPLGDLTLDGTLAQDPAARTDLSLRLDGARFECEAVRRLVRDRSSRLGEVIDTYNPAGTFAFTLHRTQAPPSPAHSEWTLAIERLALARDNQSIPISSVSGPISGTESAARIGPLRAEGDGWTMALDATWDDSAPVTLDASMGLTVSRITDSFLAGLPRPVDSLVRGLAARTDGAAELRDARLRIDASAPDRPSALEFTGTLVLDNVGITAGIPIDDISGVADIAFTQRTGEPSDFRFTLDADRARISGVSVTDAHADFGSDPNSSAILLRSFDSSAHGGRLIGRGVFRPSGSEDPSTLDYEIVTELQRADFDGILRDLRPPRDGEPAPEPKDRGRVDATLAAAGSVGAPDSKRDLHGRLTARIEGGDVLNLPGVVPLLQVWNLQLPAGERVDLAFVDAFIRDDALVFEELGLYSPSIRITGAGDIRWSDLAVDLSFQSEGRGRIPVLSELYRGLQGEIATARATGRLSDPQLKYQSLSGTKRILTAIFGDSVSGPMGR